MRTDPGQGRSRTGARGPFVVFPARSRPRRHYRFVRGGGLIGFDSQRAFASDPERAWRLHISRPASEGRISPFGSFAGLRLRGGRPSGCREAHSRVLEYSRKHGFVFLLRFIAWTWRKPATGRRYAFRLPYGPPRPHRGKQSAPLLAGRVGRVSLLRAILLFLPPPSQPLAACWRPLGFFRGRGPPAGWKRRIRAILALGGRRASGRTGTTDRPGGCARSAHPTGRAGGPLVYAT